MTLSEDVFEAMLTTPHRANRVDDEVYCQWGGDDDRYGQGVESCQITLEDGDGGSEEERVDGEDL